MDMMDSPNCLSKQLKPRLLVPSSLSGSGFFNENTFMMEKEIFKNITGYNGDYKVSNKGYVISFKYKKTRILKPDKDHQGYRRVVLSKNAEKSMIKVSRLVAIEFIPNPENKPCVNHIDGVKDNDCASNLEWVTYSENTIHAFENGLRKGMKGQNHPISKLTKKEVLEIRDKYEPRVYTMPMLSDEYGVTANHIGKIVRKELWSHI